MKLKNIDVISFGRFKDKRVEFDDGVNIIYGPNEAGKSTIHKFIEAVLFGLFKSAVKRKQYLPDHDKYQPWLGDRYEGSLIYSIKGTDYRIERNLIKGKDQVRIYNIKTGEEVTKKAEYNNVSGLYEPASLHLGISRVIYKNTLSIGQLAMRTDTELADEVRDILINLGSGRAEDISVKKAVDAIQKKLDDIGTPRAKTKKLGSVCARLDEFESELKISRKNYNEVYDIQRKINELIKDKEAVDDNIARILADIEVIKNRGYIKTVNEAGVLISQNKELGEYISKLEKYEKIDEAGLEKAIEAQNTIKTLSTDIEEFNTELDILKKEEESLLTKKNGYTGYDKIDPETADSVRTDYNTLIQLRTRNEEREKKLSEINDELDKITGINDSINDDYYRYEELEREEIKASAIPESVKMYQKVLEYSEKKKKTALILFIISLVFAPGLGIAGFLYNGHIYAIAGGVIGIMIAGVMIAILFKKKRETVEAQQELESEMYKYENNLKALKEEMDGLLEKNKVSSAVELKKKFNEFGSIILRKPKLLEETKKLGDDLLAADEDMKSYDIKIGDFLKQIYEEGLEITKENVDSGYRRYIEYKETIRKFEAVTGEIKKVSDNLKKRKDIVKSNKTMLDEILKKNDVEDIDGYKEAVNNKKKLSGYIIKKDNNDNLLSQLLKGDTYESIKEKIRDDLSDKTKHTDDLDAAMNMRDEAAKEAAFITTEMGKLEEQIKSIEKNNRPVVDISSDIDQYAEEKNELELKVEAYKSAKEMIEEISSKVRNNFAPELNKKAGEIMDVVTCGKYTKIMIDQNMTLRINDSTLGRTVDIEDLSIGTMDQLYFATRFAILDLIRPDDALPLFLDDCFVNYDHARMCAILGYIYEESVRKDRQILLFTCHEREMEEMDTRGYKYKRIDLRD